MESQTADTAEKKREWSDKKIACETAFGVMQYVLPLLSRIQYWITFLQTTRTPTISLTIYIIKDIQMVGEDLAQKASDRADDDIDAAANTSAEKILSRILVELEAEFEVDLEYDYLILAQLLDPRVSLTNGESPADIKELLNKLVSIYVPKPTQALEGNYDAWTESAVEQVDEGFTAEILVLKQQMSKMKLRKINAETGEILYEYYGGVERQQDIDIFEFYSPIARAIPNLSIGIRKILGHPSTTASCERSFNTSGNILNIRRCALDPDRAEKLILSAVRYKAGLRKNLNPPRIPSIGILHDDVESIDDTEDDQEDEIENQEDEATAWESFLV